MSIFFISDLHLHESRPATTDRFLQFLSIDAKNAEALYILGDFFEVWIGDDNLSAHDLSVMAALTQYASKIPTYFMRGNRDFLISASFLKKANITLLTDPTLIEQYGKRVLLMHGDTLCTKDLDYLRFRRFVQHPFIKWLYLSLPFSIRSRIANNIRQKSQSIHSRPMKDPSLYDATLEAIQKVIRGYNADILIHGHTHKPEVQAIQIEDHQATRIVLGDWGKVSTILEYSPAQTTIEIELTKLQQ